MPRCKNCGNTHSFGTSKVEPTAQYANSLQSGLIGDFNDQNEIVQLSSRGASKGMIAAASDNPQAYFDTCLNCGSMDIEWPENSGQNNVSM